MYKITINNYDIDIKTGTVQSIIDFLEFARFALTYENIKMINSLHSVETKRIRIERGRQYITIEKIE